MEREELFKSWTQPVSTTEDERMATTIKMIKSAVDSSTEMQSLDYEVFVQGSYANNTNIKADSDVDVCVMLKSTFFAQYPKGLKDTDYGFTAGTITYDEYYRRVYRAIVNKFGSANVIKGNKSIKINSNTYHVNADVVVAFMLKNFYYNNSKNPNVYVEGIKFISQDGKEVVNYPKVHIENGKSKNNQTNYKYKKLVRILKKARSEMVESGLVDGDKISSFLVECLVWNVPNSKITGYYTWDDIVKQAIIYLYNQMKDNADEVKQWGEVSEILYLFHSGRKWTVEDAKKFLVAAWNYLGYGNESN